jgi:hypothetical protein
MNDVADFVLVLFHSGTNAHILHLRTDSFSAHSALRNYYKEIIKLVDSFAEAYQGKFELITNYSSDYHVPIDDPIAYMSGIKDFVQESRQHLPADSEMVQLVDNIAELINSTLYKLKYLN